MPRGMKFDPLQRLYLQRLTQQTGMPAHTDIQCDIRNRNQMFERSNTTRLTRFNSIVKIPRRVSLAGHTACKMEVRNSRIFLLENLRPRGKLGLYCRIILKWLLEKTCF